MHGSKLLKGLLISVAPPREQKSPTTPDDTWTVRRIEGTRRLGEGAAVEQQTGLEAVTARGQRGRT